MECVNFCGWNPMIDQLEEPPGWAGVEELFPKLIRFDPIRVNKYGEKITARRRSTEEKKGQLYAIYFHVAILSLTLTWSIRREVSGFSKSITGISFVEILTVAESACLSWCCCWSPIAPLLPAEETSPLLWGGILLEFALTKSSKTLGVWKWFCVEAKDRPEITQTRLYHLEGKKGKTQRQRRRRLLLLLGPASCSQPRPTNIVSRTQTHYFSR